MDHPFPENSLNLLIIKGFYYHEMTGSAKKIEVNLTITSYMMGLCSIRVHLAIPKVTVTLKRAVPTTYFGALFWSFWRLSSIGTFFQIFPRKELK